MKNKHVNFLTAIFLLFTTHFYGQDNPTYSFDTANLLKHVKELASDSYEGRRTGTTGANKAKMYIINQLQALKVQPLVDDFEQVFTFTRGVTNYQAVNILGLVKGTDTSEKYIVLSAHYDHEGIKNGQIYNGADDDASGVSALFAFVEYFQKYPPKHSVILAFFDAEELGLMGSKYFVDSSAISIEKIKLNMNMDMISRNDKNELYVTGIKSHPQLEAIYNNRKLSEHISILAGHDGSDGKQNWTFSSDHGSFHRKGIPFLYFGVEDHKDYHKPTDDFENIHPEFYKNAVESIISMFKQIDALEL